MINSKGSPNVKIIALIFSLENCEAYKELKVKFL